MVAAYSSVWYQIDQAHWRLLTAAHRAEETELLAAIADRFYTKYLDEVGRAFYEAFRQSETWPPEGCKSVDELVADLYTDSTKRRAILVVDALRFDLAAELLQRLGEGILEAYVANVPSETYVGMTSLLPRVDVRLEVGDGTLRLYSEAAGGDLCMRSYRWKVLEAAGAAPLGKDKSGTRYDEIRHLFEMTEPPKDLPPILVLFDRSIDQIGHNTGHQVAHHFEELLVDLERAIRRLKTWGYDEIHVVTDHGFIALHSAADIQLLEAQKDRFTVLRARSGLLKRGELVNTATVPFRLDPSWSVALPPGLRSFSQPGTFFHGGATLQEVVVPHLQFETAPTRSRMRVRAALPKVEIHTLAVKVELVPEPPTMTGLYEDRIEGVRVKVFLGTPDAPRSVSQPVVEIGADCKEPIPVTLFLEREPPIPAGTEIPVQVIDVDTGESYATGLFVRAARDLG